MSTIEELRKAKAREQALSEMPPEYDVNVAKEVTGADSHLEDVERKISGNEETMNKVFEATKQCFKALYGEEPDMDSGVWKWYLLEAFPNNHRLALTPTKQTDK